MCALGGDLRVVAVGGEVAQRREDVADAVELPGHGVGAVLDAPPQGRGVLVELEPPLRPAGVVLAVGAPVARVRLELAPQVGDLLLPRRRLSGTPLGGRLPAREVPGALPQLVREVAAHLCVAGVEGLGHPHPGQRLDRHGEVDHRQPACLALLGDHVGARPLGRPARVDDDGVPGELAGRYLDDVAGLEELQRGDRLLALVLAPLPAGALLQLVDAVPEAGVLDEVALVAGRGLGVAVERLLGLAELPGEPDDGLVGLELGEGLLEQLAGHDPSELAHQVDGHVVGGPEGAAQRVGAGGGQAGELARVGAGLPQHDAVALGVQAASTGTAGELGVLPRRDVRVGLTVPLGELLDHHGARGHVDAQRQGLGGEDDLAQPADVELLHDLLEGRQHPCVVGRDAAREPVEEVVVAQDVQVVGVEVLGGVLDEGEDLVALLGRGEPHPGGEALGDRGVAADPAEDEDDRGQQAVALEPGDHVGSAGHPHPAPVAGLRPRLGPRATSAASVARRSAIAHPGGRPVITRDLQQLVVDGGSLLDEAGRGVDVGGGEEVEQPSADHDVLEQRHRAPLLDDRGGVATHGLQPLAELLGVGHRRRERHQAHRLRQVDDHLLPDGATAAVGEVVHLVHHDEAEPVQGARARVEHVAQHLGGHDDDRRLAVDGVVTGQQPHLVGAVAGHEVGVLLVRQRLDRRRVERLAALRERQVDGELPHHRLARAGRGCHEHAAAVLDVLARGDLELVEGEAVELAEVREHGVGLAAAEGGVPLGRALVTGRVTHGPQPTRGSRPPAPPARTPRSSAAARSAHRRRR